MADFREKIRDRCVTVTIAGGLYVRAMKQSTAGSLKVLRDEEPARLMSRIRLAWPEIKAALARGHTLKRIHALLVESSISISYKVFAQYVSRIRREEKDKLGESGPTGRKLRAKDSPDQSAESDRMANVRRLLVRDRPGFNFDDSDPDLRKLI